jgi:hypothetical protein
MLRSTFLILLITFTIGESCQPSNDTYIIILGDYTSTNHAEVDVNQPVSDSRVYFLNFTTWTWEHSNQTLPGLEGNMASPWFYFSQKFAETQPDGNIYISVIAFDLTTVSDFSYINNSKTNWLLLNKTISLIPQNVPVDVLWMIGENDADISDDTLPNNHVSSGHYFKQLSNLINWSPECYSWGISLTSYSPYNIIFAQNYIREQQALVVKSFNNFNRVWAGPDTDQLCCKYRYNSIYFNLNGTTALADKWLQMKNNKSKVLYPDDEYCNYYIFKFKMVWRIIAFIIFVGTILLTCLMLYYCCLNRGESSPRYEVLPRYVYIEEKVPLIAKD